MSQTLNIAIQTNTLTRILILACASFALSMVITPVYTTLAYRYKWWKRQRTESWSGGLATVYHKLHEKKHRRNIPTMAGTIFVASIAFVTLAGNLSRSETWLPLAGMVGAGAIGLIDDWLNIRGKNSNIAGMRAKIKFSLHTVVALIGGLWFYYKLDVSSVNVPGMGDWHIGLLIIPLFMLVVIATANAVNITDGLDGLAGGLLTSSFATYAMIATLQGKYFLAGFCLTVVGALLSYTWFNIFPARFFMGDVGSFALGTALGIIAMQTDTIFLLPIIGIIYVAETGSVIINRLSKKLRHGKKVFLSSPIHHHFEAIGWPEPKITMRFWVMGQVAAVLGLILFVLGRL
ncbi:phospho-N-acetylmuramoyl-pentapeptide-transferase [Candidatus Saccharibacteria bacterium]|nr:phospho-N-acetylmuramoyl-pentapeptide-transferase [Candidatus Saccharibacteria bacterium]MBI3338292.1 phospho-N-acetylmuramoyl-pentapeptide-transferase [Candidatus Saccharibacteria bacterium]